jgi:hypothetical protein
MNFSTDADFIDAASQEVVIALGHDKLGSTLFLNSFPFYSLSGRLNDAMSRMSYDILYYMTQSE